MLAVPNVSEAADEALLGRLQAAFGGEETVLDTHSDAIHGRSVFTLAAAPADLADHLIAGARACIDEIEMRHYTGAHPAVGALDVCPIVYPASDRAEQARELALELAPRLAELGLPVFLYGELASDEERAERQHFRLGGPVELARRMSAGEIEADFGPHMPHKSAGAVLITARPPLAAFNVEIEGCGPSGAREVAVGLRESGGGLAGVRAIAIDLGERLQISTNVHDPVAVPLAEVVAAVERLAAPHGAHPVAAEIVGLVPEAALAGYPEAVPIRDFEPARRTIEAALAG